MGKRKNNRKNRKARQRERRVVNEPESIFDWDMADEREADIAEWLMGLGADDERETRGGGRFQFDPDKGDGYWCEAHGSDCRRGCRDRRWGRFGAAGVLFVHRETGRVFLNQRSLAIHHGGTWSVLGGAIDRNESPAEGAMREAEEEMGLRPEGEIVATVTDQSAGGWTYTTVIVEVEEMFTPATKDWESMGFGWFEVNELASLKLHPAFRNCWTTVAKALFFRMDLAIGKPRR